MWWYGDMGPWGWWMMIAGSAVWLGFLLAIGVAAWAAVRSGAERGEATSRPAALEILKARYARGEITREEFQQTRRDLA